MARWLCFNHGGFNEVRDDVSDLEPMNTRGGAINRFYEFLDLHHSPRVE